MALLAAQCASWQDFTRNAQCWAESSRAAHFAGSSSSRAHHAGVPAIGQDSTRSSSGATCSCTDHHETCWPVMWASAIGVVEVARACVPGFLRLMPRRRKASMASSISLRSKGNKSPAASITG